MKNIIIIAFALTLFGCRENPIERIETSNSEIKVDLLFEHDGCKIYRFNDGGHDVYWSDCRGKMETSYVRSTGKSAYTVKVQNETIAE